MRKRTIKYQTQNFKRSLCLDQSTTGFQRFIAYQPQRSSLLRRHAGSRILRYLIKYVLYTDIHQD